MTLSKGAAIALCLTLTAGCTSARCGHDPGCLQCSSAVFSIAFSPDGRRLATGADDGTARLWDVASGKPIGTPIHHGSSVRYVAFTPDGTRLFTVAYEKTVRAWDGLTGLPREAPLNGYDVLQARNGHPVYGGQSGSFLVSSDGSRAATLHFEGKSIAWNGYDITLSDLHSHQPVGVPIHSTYAIYDFVFSPDGKTLVTASEDTTVRFWNAQTGLPQPFR